MRDETLLDSIPPLWYHYRGLINEGWIMASGKYTFRNTKAAKITPGAVLRMREGYAEGKTQRELAVEFGLSVVQVGRIVRGESWNSLPPGFEGQSEIAASAERLFRMQESLQEEGSSALAKLEGDLRAAKEKDSDSLLKELTSAEVLEKSKGFLK